mmetsp:Transcript_1216/g.1851  ORF Transcript_1216/g.1851 Transcript_1216/m.1851 type:complete len:123 (-) Transcript_1216:847-1215(-)
MDLMQYITSAKLGPRSSWVGTTSAFINHWTNQVRKYDAMGDPNDNISDVMKLAMLQNAVRDIPTLNAIVDQEAQFKVRDQNNSDLTFEQYLSLLKSAAENIDGKFNNWCKFDNRPQSEKIMQ